MMFQAFLLLGFVACGLCQVHNVDDHCKIDCSSYHGHGTPVCGSDHKTYDTMCEFSVAACYYHEAHRGHLSVLLRGACPASFTQAPPVSHCDDLCNEDIRHICGSNGAIYDNKCKFLRAQCEAAKTNQTLFIVAMQDTCPQTRTPDCTQFKLDTTDLALEQGSTFTPTCPSRREYVCASNGRTYANECYLCSYMESHSEKLTVVNDDVCLH